MAYGSRFCDLFDRVEQLLHSEAKKLGLRAGMGVPGVDPPRIRARAILCPWGRSDERASVLRH